MSATPTSLVRPAEQICSEINAVTKKAEHYASKCADLWETRAALVRELKKEYPEAWLGELKARCQIGRSQAFKIAAIADGRTDIDKEHEKQREADRRYQDKRVHRIDGLEKSRSDNAADSPVEGPGTSVQQPVPVSINAPKPPEKKPRDITMRLPQPAPETPEDLAAELMLLVDEVTRQYDSIDPPLVRAELIRLLTKDNEPIAPETPAMPIPAATEAEGNGVDVNTSAETMKSAFAELAADLTDALSGPPKRARGRPPGAKNKAKEAL